MGIGKGGALYFAWVFAAGFALGIVRTLWAAPRFGPRSAELMEAPVMFAAIVWAARWVARRLRPPAGVRARLAVGGLALGLLLVAEVVVALELRGVTVGEYVAGRDPVAVAVYMAMLAIFALMPAMAGGIR